MQQQPSIEFVPEIEEYLTSNGYHRIDKGYMAGTLVFVLPGKMAVLFVNNAIQVKVPETLTGNAIQNVLWQWKSHKEYHGFDGRNIFQLMWLLDFMDAISIKEVNKKISQELNTQLLMNTINSTYIVNTPSNANNRNRDQGSERIHEAGIHGDQENDLRPDGERGMDSATVNMCVT